MKFYRVHYYCAEENNFGFSWHTTLSEAKGYARGTSYAPIEKVQITPTKKGILWALKKYAVHPDNTKEEYK